MTFQQAHAKLLSDLQAKGWSVKTALKVPHATSPNGQVRFWFHPQSIYYTSGNQHVGNDSRSLHVNSKEITADQLIACVGRYQ